MNAPQFIKRWIESHWPSYTDEAERSAREINMPWISEAARADFARVPESVGSRAREHA